VSPIGCSPAVPWAYGSTRLHPWRPCGPRVAVAVLRPCGPRVGPIPRWAHGWSRPWPDGALQAEEDWPAAHLGHGTAGLRIGRAVEPLGGPRGIEAAQAEPLGGPGGPEAARTGDKRQPSGTDDARGMTGRSHSGTRGALLARQVSAGLGRDLREARLRFGLSQGDVATASGISRSGLGRFERGEAATASLDLVWRTAAVLGLEPSIRLFPAGVPLRDRGHLALLARFERRLRPPLRMRREVPLPIPGDRRAWDGLIEGGGRPFGAEGETHLLDLQDLTRRFELKVRDDPRVDRMILVVARTAHNRAVLREHREALRSLLPLDGWAILRAVDAGREPPAGGILVL
jgi:transcriptional regulator with XRE-family HTH domain